MIDFCIFDYRLVSNFFLPTNPSKHFSFFLNIEMLNTYACICSLVVLHSTCIYIICQYMALYSIVKVFLYTCHWNWKDFASFPFKILMKYLASMISCEVYRFRPYVYHDAYRGKIRLTIWQIEIRLILILLKAVCCDLVKINTRHNRIVHFVISIQ